MLTTIDRWFLYRLIWDATEGKYAKKPCGLDGKPVEHIEPIHSYAAAKAALEQLPNGGGDRCFTLGFYFDSSDDLFFFDLDHAIDPETDDWCDKAQEFLAMFPGAWVEVSSSGRGLHIVGRADPKDIRSKPTRELKALLAPLEIELYTQKRGMALGFSEATGDASLRFQASFDQLADEWFKPVPGAGGIGSDNRRVEWRGPEDDDTLIDRFLRAPQSAASAFGGKASLKDLWAGKCEKSSEMDGALAMHLAYWTGCDGDRMERLMWRSGMVRDKWMNHKTYLRDLTIVTACERCETVYQEALPKPGQPQLPARVAPPSNVTVTEVATDEAIDAFILKVNATESYGELCSDRVAEARDMMLPTMQVDRVAKCIIERMKQLGGSFKIGQMRHLISPPSQSAQVAGDVPEWCKSFVFVTDGDKFYDSVRGELLTQTGFNNSFARHMPFGQNGRREMPSVWATERWDIEVADSTLYYPGQKPIFEWSSRKYANLFLARSMPAPETIDAKAEAAIERFLMHIWLMCDSRQDVYDQLLFWMAHNVQKPGANIRWFPLIVGAGGDGKSLLGKVMAAAMGQRNVAAVGPDVLEASFTDWVHGVAVNVLEEVFMVGAKRYALYNNLKIITENDVITVNPKGNKTFRCPNRMNAMGLSNKLNAMPVEPDDRRVMVVYCPWRDIEGAAQARGLSSGAEMVGWLNMIFDSLNESPGMWRQFFLSIDISGFNPNERALNTPEKASMAAANQDDAEEQISEIAFESGPGVTAELFSSTMLREKLTDLPKGHSFNHMFSRMGWQKFPKKVKWRGRAHNIWHRGIHALDEQMIREILEKSMD